MKGPIGKKLEMKWLYVTELYTESTWTEDRLTDKENIVLMFAKGTYEQGIAMIDLTSQSS